LPNTGGHISKAVTVNHDRLLLMTLLPFSSMFDLCPLFWLGLNKPNNSPAQIHRTKMCRAIASCTPINPSSALLIFIGFRIRVFGSDL